MTPTRHPVPVDTDTPLPPELDRLLDAELAFDTDARRGFISHLAMGLIAAARLGADGRTLAAWFEAETDGDDDFLQIRTGTPRWLPEGIARVRRRGIDAEVRAVLPDLVDRVGGFFHWMIRLELAVDVGHPGQVANALGDWHRRPRPRGSLVVPAGSGSVAGLIEQISGEGSTTVSAAVAGVADHPDLLAETAAAVAELHWAVDDFTTLHLVTGTRAARALEPFLDSTDRRRLTHAHLHAVGSVLHHLGAPASTFAAGPIPAWSALPEWARIGAAAIETGDDHVVKLVYATRLEEAVTGRAIYRAIAARAARAT